MQAAETSTLAELYDYRLVALSVSIAIVAAYAALDLAGRVTSALSRSRTSWICGGSVAMGLGIWAMHYVGMAALTLPVPVLYDWPTVLLSAFAAILASGIALFVVSRPTMGRTATIIGSIFMGGGIAAMHYIGMAAMRMPASCHYSPSLVTLSVVLAILISYLALSFQFDFRNQTTSWSARKFGTSLLLGAAIPTLHYVGMAAVTFFPAASMTGDLRHAAQLSTLGLARIVVLTLFTLTLVIVTSIIDRRLARQMQQLADSRLQMQTIFDNMAEGVIVLDPAGNTLFVNKSAQRLSSVQAGAPFYAMVAEQFEAFTKEGKPIPPEQWPVPRALKGEFVRGEELIFRQKITGENGIRQITTVPVTGQNGKIVQIIVTYRDLTEQRRLDEARSRLAAIVDSSDDAIIGKDLNSIVTSWNDGAEKVFGYSAEEMIGQSVKALLPPDRIHEEDDILRLIQSDQQVDHFDTVRRRKDGKFIHVSLTISPIKNSTGKIVGASKIARDITERKNLERQLLESQKMEAIGQLTGGIAHDFNNLLAIILGNLDLLELHLSDDESAMKRLRPAQQATMRGVDLTRRLLAFSSIQDLKPAPTSLIDSIQTMIELAARVLGPEIKITTHLEPSLPMVFTDVTGLESALLNLFVNARDAMPRGGTLTITTRRSELDDTYQPVQAGDLKAGFYACISVSDTGQGMSRETLDRALEPFFTTKPRGKGTGLGLAMVYGFARQSGGTVRIYSELNLGTTVSLYMPLATGLAMLEPKIESAPTPRKQGGVVLVVDDEVELLEIALIYLTDMGYTTLQAKDGDSALDMVASHKEIDLVITDVIMPGGINGVELAQKIRLLNPAIRIAYSSGFPADALAEKSATPIDGPILRKPYSRTEFASIVHIALRDYPADRPLNPQL